MTNPEPGPSTIDQFPPCGSCLRKPDGEVFSDGGTEVAAVYLGMHASETSGHYDAYEELSGEDQQRLSNLLWNHYTRDNPDSTAVIARISFCGRRIGKGACATWLFDSENNRIVSK